MSFRDKARRRRNVKLKAECTILLDRIAALADMPPFLLAELCEMRGRMSPPPGVKAPVKLTNYTGIKGRKVELSVIDDYAF